MIEWTQKELLERTEAGDSSFAVFLYTPFCGTCMLTERMLNIIMTMEPELPLYKSNINFMPQISRDWQISSVPCIVIVKAGQEKRMIYQMKAVDDLYFELKQLI
jgi:thioredoxin-like negative regulator of GroEL